jgi:small subunit ribosomal protein S20
VAQIKSAEKKNRQMIKHRTRNRSVMSNLRTSVKKARTAVDAEAADAAALVKDAIAVINKAVTKGVLKKETGSRYVSRLASRAP